MVNELLLLLLMIILNLKSRQTSTMRKTRQKNLEKIILKHPYRLPQYRVTIIGDILHTYLGFYKSVPNISLWVYVSLIVIEK